MALRDEECVCYAYHFEKKKTFVLIFLYKYKPPYNHYCATYHRSNKKIMVVSMTTFGKHCRCFALQGLNTKVARMY